MVNSLRAMVDNGWIKLEAGGPGSGCRGSNCGRKGSGATGARHNFVLQVSYKGAAKDRGQQGRQYTDEDFAKNKVPAHENRISKVAQQFGGKHEAPGQHIFGNKVYHTIKFKDEDSMRQAHDKLKSMGYRDMEMQRRGGHFKLL